MPKILSLTHNYNITLASPTHCLYNHYTNYKELVMGHYQSIKINRHIFKTDNDSFLVVYRMPHETKIHTSRFSQHWEAEQYVHSLMLIEKNNSIHATKPPVSLSKADMVHLGRGVHFDGRKAFVATLSSGTKEYKSLKDASKAQDHRYKFDKHMLDSIERKKNKTDKDIQKYIKLKQFVYDYEQSLNTSPNNS